MRFKIIFTLDYEIHGNGDGSPHELMVEPTARLLNILNDFNAKLTIMADVAEILQFKKYFLETGSDTFFYNDIINQLKKSIKSQHDVQLHIHSGYFNSAFSKNKWQINWNEYDLAGLDYNIIYNRVKVCKEYLEDELSSVNPEYKCLAFRAANWSMVPTANIYHALVNNNIKIDTSLFKWGIRNGRVKFDYSNVFDPLFPWFFNEEDVCQKNNNGAILEVPIYCEHRNFLAFISFIRAYRMLRAQFHKHAKETNDRITSIDQAQTINDIKSKKNKFARLWTLIEKHAWKLDFNQATASQLINALKRIEKNYNNTATPIPIVLIGHSKSFIKYNEKTIVPFLKYIKSKPELFSFALFKDLNLESFRS